MSVMTTQLTDTIKIKIERLLEINPQPETMLPRLILRKRVAKTEPLNYMHDASICLIVQGKKRVMSGGKVYDYDKEKFLITSIDLPVTAQITEASIDEPYLGIMYQLDFDKINQLMIDHPGLLNGYEDSSTDVISVTPASDVLFSVFDRLLDLLLEPRDIPFLLPLLESELYYRLLRSDAGVSLRTLAQSGNKRHQIATAVEWLKNNYTESIKVENLAEMVGMSISSFHHHFRLFTAMTPLQYQKWLRLHEARRQLFSLATDVSTVGFKVGYESASQFSREYKRLFDITPSDDIKQLRAQSQ